MKRFLCMVVALVLFAAPAFAGENMVLAAGGGYKKMVNALAKVYKTETGNDVQLVYGNMGRVTAQAKNSGAVDMVIGARFFFSRAKLNFVRTMELGRGRLVLAWPKDASGGNDPAALLTASSAKRIAHPDPVRAIYGRAAHQYLERSGLLPEVEKHIVVVATVPQVFSYLSINEVDLGFLNLTHALNVHDSLGGFIEVPQQYYDPIDIIAGELNNAAHPERVADFFRFLKTDKARSIIRENGL